MTDGIIDLSKPTYHFEVSVWHYQHGAYSVDVDRGLGRCTIWQTDSIEKAIGVAQYLEDTGRYSAGPNGEPVENIGEPFDGSIVHWDCTADMHPEMQPTAPQI
jgi:hypothetical protein